MTETGTAAVDQVAQNDLISFLKAIHDGRHPGGVRYPQLILIKVQVPVHLRWTQLLHSEDQSTKTTKHPPWVESAQ